MPVNLLGTLIKKEHILLGLKPGTMEEILNQLIVPLTKDDNYILDPKAFIADLIAREEKVTTVMEGKFAFPHARSQTVKRLCLSVAVIPEGSEPISFSGSNQVILFFCIGVPAYTPTAHLPLLQQLASFVKNTKEVDKLLQCKTPAAIAKRLSSSH